MFTLKIETTLQDAVSQWAKSPVSNPIDRDENSSIKGLHFTKALEKLFSEFCRGHNNYDDKELVRLYYFFEELGLCKHLSQETEFKQRIFKILRKE